MIKQAEVHWYEAHGIGKRKMNFKEDSQVLATLYTPPWRTITDLAVSTGVGAIAVYFLETLFPRTAINRWEALLALNTPNQGNGFRGCLRSLDCYPIRPLATPKVILRVDQ